jgi:hypothetical protein
MPGHILFVTRPTITSLALTAAVVLSSGGCTIQDVFRATLGGVNSDQAALNKVNPANEYSYPHDDNRTVWRLPEAEK